MMRKKRYAVIFMVLFLAATAIYIIHKNSEPIIHVPMPKDEIIVWSDKEVERQVREQAGKSEGDVWLSDLWDIYSIKLEGEEIYSIRDLSVLLNLNRLSLVDTSVTDLSPLAGLKVLFTLRIEGGDSRILDSVGQLKYVLELSLEDLQINSLDNLKSDKNIKTAPNLSTLALNYNELEEITEISSLKNLVRLELSYNNLKEIKSLKSAYGIQNLCLTVSELENYDFLEGMEKLFFLDLSGTDLSKLKTPMPNIESLHKIRARDCKLTNLEIFTGLEHMKWLDVRANNLQDLSAVSQLKELSHLDISKNVGLGKLVFPANNNITMVVAEECELKSLDVFLPVSGLLSLDVSGNKIESVEAIRGMKKLKEIDINDNVIQPNDVLSKFAIDLEEWGWQ